MNVSERLQNVREVLSEAKEVTEAFFAHGRHGPGASAYGSETGHNVHRSFNPVDYDFKWVKDWYEWDRAPAHKKAMQHRNKEAADFKKRGWKVRKSTVKNQLIKRGGIGTGKPELDFHVTIYIFDASREEDAMSSKIDELLGEAQGETGSLEERLRTKQHTLQDLSSLVDNEVHDKLIKAGMSRKDASWVNTKDSTNQVVKKLHSVLDKEVDGIVARVMKGRKS